jgi:hypothetical protein
VSSRRISSRSDGVSAQLRRRRSGGEIPLVASSISWMEPGGEVATFLHDFF